MQLENIEFKEIEAWNEYKETFKSSILVDGNQAGYIIGTGNPMCDLEVEVSNLQYLIEFFTRVADTAVNNYLPDTTIDIRVQRLKNDVILFEIDGDEVCLIDHTKKEKSITIKDEWQFAIIVKEVYGALSLAGNSNEAE